MSDKQKNFLSNLKNIVLSNREKFVISLLIIGVGVIILIYAFNGFDNIYIAYDKILTKMFRN